MPAQSINGAYNLSLFELAIQALVQGITEFLPVSSSGHLILVRSGLGWPDPGLDFDVAIHVGTLVAVIIYLRSEVSRLFSGALTLFRGHYNADARLFMHIMIATLPIVIAGYIGKSFVADVTRTVSFVAATTFVFGVLLYFADRTGTHERTIDGLTPLHALAIGIAQVFALLPGTSRSGVTMTVARVLGYKRVEATRFSFLISIPTIAGAGLLATMDLVAHGNMQLGLDAAVAAMIAFASAWVAMNALIHWVEKNSFAPFVIYRVVLGSILLLWLLV